MRSLLFVPAIASEARARARIGGRCADPRSRGIRWRAANRGVARARARGIPHGRTGPSACAAMCGSTRYQAGSPSTISPRRICRAGPTASSPAEMPARGRPHGGPLPVGLRGGVRGAGGRDAHRRDRHRDPRRGLRARGLRRSVAAVSKRITWGAEDLSASIGGNNRHDRRRPLMTAPITLRVPCACWRPSAAGVIAIDTIYTDFRDEAGLRAECLAARRSGFAAKMAIHPAQLAAITSVLDRRGRARMGRARHRPPLPPTRCRHPRPRRQR